MAEQYPGDTAECRTPGADAAMLSDESYPRATRSQSLSTDARD